MAQEKRAFRSEQSYAFERVARDAVKPLLASRGFRDIDDQRRRVGLGQSQILRARSPEGHLIVMRVRLCWRRDGRSPREELYSASQLRASTLDGDWNATLDHVRDRDEAEGVTHSLFFQRDALSDVYALLVPTSAVPAIWHAQRRISDEQQALGTLDIRKNHATNGDSPTIWLQDDRAEGGRHVAEVVWNWPGVIDIIALPIAEVVSRPKYWRMFDAVVALQRPVTVAEVQEWLDANLPGKDYSDTRENLTLLTVNDAIRRHYDRARKSFRSDQSHPRDLLLRSNEGDTVRYEPYDPRRHGVFDLLEIPGQGWTVVQVESSELTSVLADADEEAEAQRDAISSLEDARDYVLRTVAARRGQRSFRDALLEAYGGCCAITGCDVLAVLEAAHIVPYLGAYTQRTDNGLLLRADIHTLFDLGELWIDDGLCVRVSEGLTDSEYGRLAGKSIYLPKVLMDRPNSRHLESHRDGWGRN